LEIRQGYWKSFGSILVGSTTCSYNWEAVKKCKDSQSGQRDVGKTVERLPFSGLIIRIENHVRLIA
jgi:hypothetical protein